MRLAEYNEVIEGFSSNRLDRPFDVSVLHGRLERYRAIADCHGTNAVSISMTVSTVAIRGEISRPLVQGKGFSDLPCN